MEAQIKKNEEHILELEEQIRKEKNTDITQYINYEEFEKEFRGSSQEVKNRVKRYLEWFSPDQKVLDLGCGRGDWLEVLGNYGVNAIGIDLDFRSVKSCQDKGLNAMHSDMFEYLENSEDESFDGITSLQVIEHIEPVRLFELVGLCHQKLRKGGVLVLETPNPTVLYTMLVNFYVDPTHIRPVHPNWLKFVLESVGFSDVYIDYPEYSVQSQYAQPHIMVTENQEDANRRVDALNSFLFGPTDYAIIAHK
jgi:O-antigen chain-terminating methyltransferase